MVEIVLATRNRKKVEEIRRIFEGLTGFVFRTLDDFPSCPEVDEDADTFEGNAIKKAITVACSTGMPSIADDSGLEVYALNNAPGVMSARYAGPDGGDGANNDKLLESMKHFTDDRRGARFVCCIAFALPDGNVRTFTGFSEGTIGLQMLGRSGFGYDPLFYPRGHTKTFAEMPPEEKDSLSHRKRALEQLKAYLETSVS
ncbi:MAG: RdgB/HAM1 family non-canonical purine NTP pyrophosphatase [Nitrospirae bacterium]|nr:RdgB/HAM1 family non-canonical purine NTP pyrophosphatase [Nitrospirota bacterium]